MIKRVKLDDNGYLTEIDWNAARRWAAALKDYIETAPLEEKLKFGYDSRVLPLIESVLDGSIEFPFPYANEPYDTRAIIDGYYPPLVKQFSQIYSELLYRISGSVGSCSLSAHKTGEYIFGQDREVDEEGNVYEVCWFDD